jgi:hypothetical protein
MPDPERERLYVEHLRDVYSAFPEGQLHHVEPHHDPPDFTVTGDDSTVTGIEVTEFHLPPLRSQHSERATEELKDEIVAQACRRHREAGGPALYVQVYFLKPLEVPKDGIPDLAEDLAATVLRADVPKRGEDQLRLAGDALPKGIEDVSIDAAVGAPLWQPGRGSWIAELKPSDVQRVITKKGRTASAAKAKCDRLWLVIVSDGFSNAVSIAIEDAVTRHRYEHPFDRVLWFEADANRVYELKGAGGSPEP